MPSSCWDGMSSCQKVKRNQFRFLAVGLLLHHEGPTSDNAVVSFWFASSDSTDYTAEFLNSPLVGCLTVDISCWT